MTNDGAHVVLWRFNKMCTNTMTTHTCAERVSFKSLTAHINLVLSLSVKVLLLKTSMERKIAEAAILLRVKILAQI